jgi:hypothetical protein
MATLLILNTLKVLIIMWVGSHELLMKLTPIDNHGKCIVTTTRHQISNEHTRKKGKE